MKVKSKIRLAVVALLILLAYYAAVFGANVFDYQVLPFGKSISMGMDLKEGTQTEFVAADTAVEGYDEMMESAASILHERLVFLGYTQSTAQREGENGILVEIPKTSAADDLFSIIGETGHVEFRDPDGNVIAEGKDVKDVYVNAITTSGQYYTVGFALNKTAAAKYAETTANFNGQSVSVYLDDTLISSIDITEKVSDGKGTIAFDLATSQSESYESALTLVMKLEAGELPVALTAGTARDTSPTLGQNVLKNIAIALGIALVLAIVIMIFKYRLAGVAAGMGVLISVWVTLVLVSEIAGVVLTLPGIFGLLLGVGYAFIANIVTLDRFLEELSTGRPLAAAVTFSYKSALMTVVDAGMVLIIGSIALLVFGNGVVRGFAAPLLISAVMSLVTAVLVTRFLLRQIIGLGCDKRSLYMR